MIKSFETLLQKDNNSSSKTLDRNISDTLKYIRVSIKYLTHNIPKWSDTL